jgi:phosphohistidine phosphatase SixA
MRELILLRHAHADAATANQSDAARGLSATGREEARAAGDWLRQHGLHPDRVLCSPATRARETLTVLGDIGAGEIYEEAGIYEASPGTLAALVDANRDAERLLLVGHNPGIEQLVALMHSGQSGDYRGMPPGGIAVLKLPVGGNVEPGIATLTEFWWP